MTANVDATLSALADPTRRALVGMLSKGPLRPSEIADALSATRPAVSRHLGVLRRAGLVTERIQAEDARIRIYTLLPKPFEDLRGWIEEVEAFWHDQLHAFKAHAEKGFRGRKE